MKTDIEIAQEAEMLHIREVAQRYGITEEELELFGKYKAKLTDELWEQVKDRKDGKPERERQPPALVWQMP